MSYLVYRHWYNAKIKTEELENGSNEDYLKDKIFTHIKNCFDGIYNVAKFNKNLYFNLKENWALLKQQKYNEVLINIANWLVKADDRFDGETWTEKVQTPKPTGELIVGEIELQKFYNILNDEMGLIEHENGVNYITGSEVEFEIDDEDYDRIYFDVPKHYYSAYKHGLKVTLTNLLLEAGVTNFKINERFGEIKFYNVD